MFFSTIDEKERINRSPFFFTCAVGNVFIEFSAEFIPTSFLFVTAKNR